MARLIFQTSSNATTIAGSSQTEGSYFADGAGHEANPGGGLGHEANPGGGLGHAAASHRLPSKENRNVVAEMKIGSTDSISELLKKKLV